ncbi:DMT family transporter [Brucella intermedia]|uniref:DMT family transporter n=1 Tax=Brucella intermedia TaxID=94625 RepID=UPI00224B4A96|nr:DMT family transporter [Brucella intermedia]
MRSSREIGLLATFGEAFFLSFDTLFLRLIGGDAVQVAFWRGVLMLSSGILAAAATTWLTKTRLSLINGRVGLAVAAFYGSASICFVFAALLTSIANMLVIVATAPLWAAVGATIFLGEHPPRRTWIACIVSLAGIGLVMWPGLSQEVNAGDVIALGAALSMAAAFVLSRLSSENLVLAPATGGLISALALVGFVDTFWFQDASQLAFMAFEGAILVPVALGLIAMAPRYLPAPQVGLFLLLETVLGPLWVWAIIGEVPTGYALAGGALVILTLLAHSTMTLRHRPEDVVR